MTAPKPKKPIQPVPFDDALRRILAAPPAPKVAKKKKK
jgi:hypothetical protein